MDEVQPNAGNEKKSRKVLVIAIVIISCSAVIGTALSLNILNSGPKISTTYSGVAPDIALNLAANNETIIIVDVRSCKCNYNKEHLPNAVWETDWAIYYNETKDILVYDSDGSDSISYCEHLINNMYGAIYYLEGGINAWKEAGYPTIT